MKVFELANELNMQYTELLGLCKVLKLKGAKGVNATLTPRNIKKIKRALTSPPSLTQSTQPARSTHPDQNTITVTITGAPLHFKREALGQAFMTERALRRDECSKLLSRPLHSHKLTAVQARQVAQALGDLLTIAAKEVDDLMVACTLPSSAELSRKNLTGQTHSNGKHKSSSPLPVYLSLSGCQISALHGVRLNA